MNLRQAAKTRMFIGFDTYLDTNVSVFTGNKPFIDLQTKYKSGLKIVNDLAARQSSTKTGYSEDKRNAKNEMCTAAAILSGFALVAFKEKGKTLEASQLHISITDFTGLNDSEAPALVMSTYNLLHDNIADLTNLVAQSDLDNLLALYNTYINTQGSSEAVNANSPVQTAEFNAAINDQMKLIADIRLLARKYMKSNDSFYQGLIAASTVPAVNVHHTTFSLNLTDKANKTPIGNATGMLTVSKNSGTSDAQGYLTIEHVRSGNSQLTLKANGYKDIVIEVMLTSGHDNHFDMEMEAA